MKKPKMRIQILGTYVDKILIQKLKIDLILLKFVSKI